MPGRCGAVRSGGTAGISVASFIGRQLSPVPGNRIYKQAVTVEACVLVAKVFTPSMPRSGGLAMELVGEGNTRPRNQSWRYLCAG